MRIKNVQYISRKYLIKIISYSRKIIYEFIDYSPNLYKKPPNCAIKLLCKY